MSYLTDRRRFLKTTALTGVGVFVSGTAAAEDSKSPNERIRFACIGVGGKGSGDSADAKRAGDLLAAHSCGHRNRNLTFTAAQCRRELRHRAMTTERTNCADAAT